MRGASSVDASRDETGRLRCPSVPITRGAWISLDLARISKYSAIATDIVGAFRRHSVGPHSKPRIRFVFRLDGVGGEVNHTVICLEFEAY